MPFANPADSISEIRLITHDGGTGAKGQFDNITIPGNTSTQPGSDTSLSFETGTGGSTVPPTPWNVSKDTGTHVVGTDRASHGNKSLYLTGAPSLGQSWVRTEVNLTGVSTIRGDIYPESSDTYAGDIKVHIDNTSYQIMGATEKANGQWHSLQGNVSELSGTHTLIFRTRGNDNRAYFDHFRLYDESGVQLDPGAVVQSGTNETASPGPSPVNVSRSISPESPASGATVDVTVTVEASTSRMSVTEGQSSSIWLGRR